MSQPISDSQHKVGENNVQVFGMDIHNPVFAISALLILVFVITTLFTAFRSEVRPRKC